MGHRLGWPLKKAKGNRECLIMVTDYFSKRIELVPLTRIIGAFIKSFIWKNIISRFGIPHTILIDNGIQFSNSEVTNWYKELEIRHLTSTPRYPHCNGQAEASNKTILKCLKKKLEKKSKWPKELPRVL